MMGSSMVPEMTRRGYKKYMSMGPILGSGSLAILIPPSALVVLLGSLMGALTAIDIGRLLIGGIVPGLILATFYAVLIFVQVKFDPEAAPRYDVEPDRASAPRSCSPRSTSCRSAWSSSASSG